MSLVDGWGSYERRLVPRIVVPFAGDITDALTGVQPGRFVVDLAAGTGATGEAITAARRGVFTVAVDLDGDALVAGRALDRNNGRAVRGDAQRLPVRTGTVAEVVCQNGLQFFPDLDAVCREVERVLQPGGRLVALTWSSLAEVSLFAALSELADTIGVGPAFQEPCSLDSSHLADSLARAGLVVTDQRPITRTLPMTETRAQHADLLAHWVEASPSVLVDPWREADLATREEWVTRFGNGLARRGGRMKAVLTVAHR